MLIVLGLRTDSNVRRQSRSIGPTQRSHASSGGGEEASLIIVAKVGAPRLAERQRARAEFAGAAQWGQSLPQHESRTRSAHGHVGTRLGIAIAGAG